MRDWTPLSARALAVARVETVVSAVILILAGCAIRWAWQVSLTRVLLVPVASALVVWAVVDIVFLTPRRHARYRYRVDDRVLELCRGVLIASELLIPLSQVLYVDIRQGPIVRLLGLTTVRIGTVGSAHDIGPLEPEAAQSLAALVGRR